MWLRNRGEPERQTSVYEEVLHRVGERHEKEYLARLGAYLDLSLLDEDRHLQELRKPLPAEFQFYAGFVVVVQKHSELETYYEHRNNTSSAHNWQIETVGRNLHF